MSDRDLRHDDPQETLRAALEKTAPADHFWVECTRKE